MRLNLRIVPILLILLFIPGRFVPNNPFLNTGELQIHLIYVGQGDSILIATPEGKLALIDAGNPNSGALEYLQSRGVKYLDLVVVTHQHGDHVGDMSRILATIPTNLVVTNRKMSQNFNWLQLLEWIEKSELERWRVQRGDILELGSVRMEVLNPPVKGGIHHPDFNNNSIVLRLEYGTTEILLVGDAEFAAENEMMAAGLNLDADILKLGHHGAYTSTSPEFLAAVSPETAVYSAGVNNDLGFPSPSTLENLKKSRVNVYGTDRYGTLIIKVNQSGYTIQDEDGNQIH